MKIRSATLEYQGQVFTFTSKSVLGATGAWVLEDVTGWFGGVGVRAETTERLRHGTFKRRAWRGDRALTLSATYVANDPDERLDLERALSAMLWDGGYGTLTVEADRVLSCPVRLDGEVGIVEMGTHGVQLQVPLLSPDPWLYGESRSSFLYPPGTGAGLEYPLFSGVAEVVTWGENLASNSGMSSLAALMGTGYMSGRAGAEVSISDEWSSSGGTSLRVGPATGLGGSAFLLPRFTDLGRWAGRFVTVSGVVRLAEAQADNPVSSKDRALVVGVESATAGADPVWEYAVSPQVPNAAGEFRTEISFVLPDDLTEYSGWFIRAYNGSQVTPVWFDDVEVRAATTRRASPLGSLVLGVPGDKIVQALDVDPVAGDFYVVQLAPGEVDVRVHRVAADGALLETMLLPRGGHMADVAVERDADGAVWVWSYWPAHPDGVVRVRFREGTVRVDDDDVQGFANPVPGVAGYASIRGGKLGFKHKVAGVDQFRVYDLEAFKAGEAEPLWSLVDEVTPSAHDGQGWAFTDDFAYVSRGGSKGDPLSVWRYEWSTGAVKVIRTSRIGLAGGSRYEENEGICIRPDGTIVAVVASGLAGKRVATAFAIDAAEFDAPFVTGDVSEQVLRYGTAQFRDESVMNAGNADAYPTILVRGDAPGGVSIGAGTGTGAIEYPWPITAESPLRVETSGSAWVGDTNVTARLTKRDFGLFKIGPGRTLSPSITELQNGDVYGEVHVRDTYI